jgi:hypothetical protein
MIRREFITLVAGAMVEWPFASIAQEAGRIYRFGILEPFADTPVSCDVSTNYDAAASLKAKTSQSMEKDAPVPRAVERAGHINCRPVLGGLHHQYVRI